MSKNTGQNDTNIAQTPSKSSRPSNTYHSQTCDAAKPKAVSSPNVCAASALMPTSRLNCPQASLRFTVSTKSPSPISVIPATDFRSRKSLYCLAITASEGALPRLYIHVEGGPTNSTPTTTLICEGSSRLGLIFQKARQDLRCKIEVGALQTFHSESKIQ